MTDLADGARRRNLRIVGLSGREIRDDVLSFIRNFLKEIWAASEQAQYSLLLFKPLEQGAGLSVVTKKINSQSDKERSVFKSRVCPSCLIRQAGDQPCRVSTLSEADASIWDLRSMVQVFQETKEAQTAHTLQLCSERQSLRSLTPSSCNPRFLLHPGILVVLNNESKGGISMLCPSTFVCIWRAGSSDGREFDKSDFWPPPISFPAPLVQQPLLVITSPVSSHVSASLHFYKHIGRAFLMIENNPSPCCRSLWCLTCYNTSSARGAYG